MSGTKPAYISLSNSSRTWATTSPAYNTLKITWEIARQVATVLAEQSRLEHEKLQIEAIEADLS